MTPTTRITLDLDDEIVDYLQRRPQATGCSSVEDLIRLVKEALPPERIEPKAGGTCHLQHEEADVHGILYADDLWDDVDQARRAWAITQACRLWSGTGPDALGDDHILIDQADMILAYVLEQQ